MGKGVGVGGISIDRFFEDVGDKNEMTGWFESAVDLGKDLLGMVSMVKSVGTEDKVKEVVFVRQVFGSAGGDVKALRVGKEFLVLVS